MKKWAPAFFSTKGSNRRKMPFRRMAFSPMKSSTQDIAFTEFVQEYQGSRQLLVIQSFRGCRKSYVAERCSHRSKFLPWMPLVEYWDLSEKSTQELKVFLNRFSRPPRAIEAIHFLRSIVICVFLGLMWTFLQLYRSGRELTSLSAKEFVEAVTDELPAKAGLAVFGLSLLCFLRKRVIVLDGVVSAPTKAPGMAQGRQALDLVSSIAKYNSVILITSNDGIRECFDDTAPLLRNFVTFPHATEDELLAVLKVVADISTHKISEAVVATAIGAHLPHHAFSIRWWSIMCTTGGIDCLKNKENVDRAPLWKVVLELDCKCSETFRAQCLGLSPPVSESDRQKLEKLSGCLPPENCPRRLALAWCLVESTTDEEFMIVKRLRDALVQACELSDPLTENYYQDHLQPLVELIDRKFPYKFDMSPAWVRKVGGDSVFKVTPATNNRESQSDAFSVTPASNNIDSLKDAIKAEAPSTVTCDAFQLTIYEPGDATKKVVKQSTPLVANTGENPYLFALPGSEEQEGKKSTEEKEKN